MCMPYYLLNIPKKGPPLLLLKAAQGPRMSKSDPVERCVLLNVSIDVTLDWFWHMQSEYWSLILVCIVDRRRCWAVTNDYRICHRQKLLLLLLLLLQYQQWFNYDGLIGPPRLRWYTRVLIGCSIVARVDGRRERPTISVNEVSLLNSAVPSASAMKNAVIIDCRWWRSVLCIDRWCRYRGRFSHFHQNQNDLPVFPCLTYILYLLTAVIDDCLAAATVPEYYY